MIKATILAVGASAAVFSAMLAAPAQAAPVTSVAGGGGRGPCENSAGDGGLLGIGALNFQQNNCDIDFFNGHMGRHHEHHWGDWD